MSGVFEINLERDGHDQPWGFRLQGGHDVGLPLTIQRILVGTPAEGVLRKGDILCKVSRTDTKGLSHQQAADLFTKAGNQIKVYIKRPGVAGVPLPNTGIPNSPQPAQQAFTGIAINSPTRSPAPAAETLLMNLPKSRVSTKTFTASTHQAISTHSSPLSLTIQDQPYRTSPLIQPSAKHNPEIGPGSTSHLKMQADYLTGAKEAQPSPDAQQAKATEFVMKQKVRKTFRPPFATSDSEYHTSSKMKSSSISDNLTNSSNERRTNAKNDSEFSKIGKFVWKLGGEIVSLKNIPIETNLVEEELPNTSTIIEKETMIPNVKKEDLGVKSIDFMNADLKKETKTDLKLEQSFNGLEDINSNDDVVETLAGAQQIEILTGVNSKTISQTNSTMSDLSIESPTVSYCFNLKEKTPQNSFKNGKMSYSETKSCHTNNTQNDGNQNVSFTLKLKSKEKILRKETETAYVFQNIKIPKKDFAS